MDLQIIKRKDFFFQVLLIFVYAIAGYFLPRPLPYFFYVISLILFWQSRDNVFWFSNFFLLYDNVMGINFGEFYNIDIGSSGYKFIYIFSIVSFLKVLMKTKGEARIFEKKYLLFLGLYFIVFVIPYSFVLGTNATSQFHIIRAISGILMFYSVSKIFQKPDDFFRFFIFLTPWIFFSFLLQVFSIVFRYDLVLSILPNMVGTTVVTDNVYDVDTLIRSVTGVSINLICFITAVFYLITNQYREYRIWLISVFVVAYGSIFLSATRGWIIAYSVLIIMSLLFFSNFKRIVYKRLIIAIPIIIFVFNLPQIKGQFELVVNRLYTVEDIVNEKDQDYRQLERIPRVYNKYKERPILGWGFSVEGVEYSDLHVGNYTLLLKYGVFGFVLIIILFLKYLLFSIRFYDIDFKAFFLFFVLLSLLIIHSTSRIVFSFEYDSVLLSTFFSFSYWVAFFFREKIVYKI